MGSALLKLRQLRGDGDVHATGGGDEENHTKGSGQTDDDARNATTTETTNEADMATDGSKGEDATNDDETKRNTTKRWRRSTHGVTQEGRQEKEHHETKTLHGHRAIETPSDEHQHYEGRYATKSNATWKTK